jgi:hypothetical protein
MLAYFTKDGQDWNNNYFEDMGPVFIDSLADVEKAENYLYEEAVLKGYIDDYDTIHSQIFELNHLGEVITKKVIQSDNQFKIN